MTRTALLLLATLILNLLNHTSGLQNLPNTTLEI